MLFDQFATVTQAAVAGLGLALLPEFLIEPEIDDGSLVAALPLPMRSSESYHLVWPSARAQHPPLEAFRDWILAETAQDR